jgi:hypothetical protein
MRKTHVFELNPSGESGFLTPRICAYLPKCDMCYSLGPIIPIDRLLLALAEDKRFRRGILWAGAFMP